MAKNFGLFGFFGSQNLSALIINEEMRCLQNQKFFWAKIFGSKSKIFGFGEGPDASIHW